jgi:hypothetical protein
MNLLPVNQKWKMLYKARRYYVKRIPVIPEFAYDSDFPVELCSCVITTNVIIEAPEIKVYFS